MDDRVSNSMTDSILDEAIGRLAEIEKVPLIDDCVGQSFFYTEEQGSVERPVISSDRSMA